MPSVCITTGQAQRWNMEHCKPKVLGLGQPRPSRAMSKFGRQQILPITLFCLITIEMTKGRIFHLLSEYNRQLALRSQWKVCKLRLWKWLWFLGSMTIRLEHLETKEQAKPLTKGSVRVIKLLTITSMQLV